MKDDTWGFSSTGDFWDVWGTSKDYIAENVSRLRMNDSLLYMNARLSPLSLTYYARCLANGNYTVKLHFAEIIFGDNKSFSSVGRRMFDVYIQNELVLKDFDIEKEAQGIDKAVIRNFTAIVKYKTLEIRFYWSGKGTQDIPMRGTYGSLISAIAIDSEQSLKHNRRLITAIGISAAVAGIAVISFVIICTIKRGHFPINSMVRWKRDAKNDHFNTEEIIKNYGSIAPKRYTYSDVKKFTNSFKDKVGEGGYGVVYKGKLPDGRMVAAKILSMSKGNGEEFINEVASISRTSHVNIVTLLGFCYERTKRALIYEFMPSGSLDKFIYDKGSQITNFQLDSKTMFQIAIGIARGLEYLHRGCNTRILHFDIKPQNILLDEDLCPKISDFGLAKLCKTKDSIVSMTGMRGTIGYIALEVFSRNFGGVSYKSDVYSYGMLVLEMVGARKFFDGGISHTSEIYFPHWIYSKLEHGESLGTLGDITEEEEDTIKKMILVSLWCTQTNPSDRPSMDKVIDMLEGSLQSLQFPPKSSMYSPVRSPQDSFPTSESHILTL